MTRFREEEYFCGLLWREMEQENEGGHSEGLLPLCREALSSMFFIFRVVLILKPHALGCSVFEPEQRFPVSFADLMVRGR